METSERRTAVLKLLCRRRHETIKNLADEFGVSERTIRRDIETLSLSEPIYTQAGRYGGGVYVMPNYDMNRMYFQAAEKEIMNKVLDSVERGTLCTLTPSEIVILRKMIADYTKPSANKSGVMAI